MPGRNWYARQWALPTFISWVSYLLTISIETWRIRLYLAWLSLGIELVELFESNMATPDYFSGYLVSLENWNIVVAILGRIFDISRDNTYTYNFHRISQHSSSTHLWWVHILTLQSRARDVQRFWDIGGRNEAARVVSAKVATQASSSAILQLPRKKINT